MRSRNHGALLCVLGVAVLLSGCWSPRPSTLDPEIKAFSEGGHAAFSRGEVERAGSLYGKALQRARLTDSRDEVARNTYNLALCRIVEGKVSEARSLLSQARVLFPDRGVEIARVLLAEAEVARLEGDASESAQLAGQAVECGADREGRAQASVLRGEAALAAGQSQAALIHYRAAGSLVTGLTPAVIRARLKGLESRLIQAQLVKGDVAGVEVARAGWLRKAGQFSEMAEALDAASEAFEHDGKLTEAFDCRIRAAQSLLAAGRREAAKQAVERAGVLAAKTANAGHKALVAGVVRDLKE